MLGIERPDVKLFMSTTEAVTSQREILILLYREGLDAVTKLLSKAAPLTDLYLYLRDHPLQNPAKAKVHCEHGFGSLRLAVKAYLDVSLYSLSLSISMLIIYYLWLKKCKHLVPKVLRRSFSLIMRSQSYINNVYTDPQAFPSTLLI